MSSMITSVDAGFIALNDSAILIIAKECGFAEEEGIHLRLHKETSWATLRDKLAIGQFDVAHLLAPIPIAARCNLFALPLDIVVPMALGLGGNMITFSQKIWCEHFADAKNHDFDARAAGARLNVILQSRNDSGLPKLKFGAVHPYSAHNYELRYWLAACGINPDRDMDIVFLPPSTMPDALKSGAIDGFCVGEPWNSKSILDGDGMLLTTKSHIWKSSPDKVLGVRRSFAEEHTEAHFSLLRAFYKAALWIQDARNGNRLCEILASPDYIGLDKICLHPGFSGMLDTGMLEQPKLSVPDFYLSASRAATFPWRSHALWFYSQMVRWGHLTHSPDNVDKVSQAYHPSLLLQALAPMNVAMPKMDLKLEGALSETMHFPATHGEIFLGPDEFFDGKQFDPLTVAAYIESQKLL